jgi:glycosyltransferase involved in cell wall biosynthesis
LNTIDKVTVGMPVCNAMPCLQETMASLLNQTTDRFEILAIVDGGGDDSLAYLRAIRDSRLRILEQPNRGLTYTLNRMLRECQTPWLVRQDADDVSHPNRMERILSAIEKHPDAGMFYSFANYHPRGSAIGSFRCSRGTPVELRNIVSSGYLLSICHSTVTLNVRKTLGFGGYRLGLHNEDADLWWRMALQYDIRCIPEVLVGFRQSPSSISSVNLVEQVVAGLYVQYLLLSHLWKRLPRSIEEVRPHLESLLSRREFRAKQRLRSFNIDMAQNHYAGAARAFCAALSASPSYVVRRTCDEWFSSRRIANGVHPSLYLKRKEALWS